MEEFMCRALRVHGGRAAKVPFANGTGHVAAVQPIGQRGLGDGSPPPGPPELNSCPKAGNAP
jgi:hypothetical protein